MTKVTYLNWRGPQGRETIDEVRREDFPSHSAYRAEISRMCREYALAGMACYPSRRACKGWS